MINLMCSLKPDMGILNLSCIRIKPPITVSNFLKHVDAGLYNHAVFYRGQTGGWRNGQLWCNTGRYFNLPEKSETAGIPHESTGQKRTYSYRWYPVDGPNCTRYRINGVFICLGDQSSLDSGRRGSPDGLGYAAFGKVFSGMKTVRKIQDQPAEGDLFK